MTGRKREEREREREREEEIDRDIHGWIYWKLGRGRKRENKGNRVADRESEKEWEIKRRVVILAKYSFKF